MARQLTIHLVIQNHKNTIERTLESILPLGGDVLVADIGSSDGTAQICQQYGAQVVRLSLNDDYSQVRNTLLSMSKSAWHLYLEPWESLLHGHGLIAAAMRSSPAVYQMSILQADVVTKEIRFWHKDLGIKFQNPVFETVVADAANLDVYIASPSHAGDDKMNLVLKWRERQPLAVETYYYEACLLLTKKQWRKFLTTADHYIFQEKQKKMSLVMLRYYCAMVYCYVEKNYQKAAEHLLPCLAEKPLMAEFWCLLADIYYVNKKYEKARTFYDNAIILGSRRLKSDDWPLEIAKYKEYPNKMINACNTLLDASRVYKG